jgi:hypothetical protein
VRASLHGRCHVANVTRAVGRHGRSVSSRNVRHHAVTFSLMSSELLLAPQIFRVRCWSHVVRRNIILQ